MLSRVSVAFAAAPGVLGGLAAVVVLVASDSWDLGPGPRSWSTRAPASPARSSRRSCSSRAGSRPARAVWHPSCSSRGACAGLAALTTALALAAETATAGAPVVAQLQSFLWVPGFLPMLTLVPMLYPNGLLPGRRGGTPSASRGWASGC